MVYIEEKRSKFFQFPEPRKKFRIFPSPRAYIEETMRRMTPLRQQAVFEGGGETGIFPSPRVFMERESS